MKKTSPSQPFTLLRPLGDRVIVRPDELAQKSASGIILSEKSAEKPTTGTVVAVGPGKRSEVGEIVPMDISVGDRVLYPKYIPEEFKHDGID